MKFLVDSCVGRRLAEWLRAEGHDVLRVQELGPDPGDRQLLERAAAEGRVLVTLDKHFGRFVFLDEEAHAGLVRLPDVPVARRIELLDRVLKLHSEDLEALKAVTVQGTRIRVSVPPSLR